jgi:glycine oxidase
MAETSDVVIVGGGAAGSAVAYYLSLAGVKATIVEKEGVASQASGFSAGGLNPLQGAEIPGRLGALAWASYLLHLALWEELPEETGIGYDGRVMSAIRLAFEESELPELQETLDVFGGAAGFEARWLDPSELSALEPRVTTKAVRALLTRGNAAVDSQRYTQALVEAAKKRGASVRPGEIQGLETSGARVTSVKLSEGSISCGLVVLAMGPWSRLAEPWLNTYIPVDPLKGEILRMELPGPPIRHDISGGGGSTYSKPDGLVWCGATEEWKGFDKSLTDSAEKSLRDRAERLVPDLAGAKLAMHTACLRPVTPDWLPIIGQPPGWENVYLATGAGKKGVLLSPAMGKAVAELIHHGESSLPIGGFSPERFAAMGSV